MDELQKLEKPFIREICLKLSLDSSGSKRQLLNRIAEGGVSEDVLEGHVEDILEREAEKALKAEQERRDREAQKEREERELKQLELQVEMERIKASNGYNSSSGSQAERSEIPRVKMSQYMSAYEVGADIGYFLTNFERLGTQLGVPQDQWATQLLKLLPTEVATVIARMPADEASMYVSVKRNLLERFKLSPEAFRQRFRKASRQPGQPYSELAFYLESNLHEWIKGAGAGESVENLTELMALEQFFELLPNNLKHWILDRAPKTLREACRLADEYEERRDKQGSDSGSSSENQPFKANYSKNKFSKNGKSRAVESEGDQVSSSEKTVQGNDFNCFSCGQKGHFAKTCDKTKLLAACFPIEHDEKAADLVDRFKLPIKVNGKEVSALRDTGSTFDIVEPTLVRQEDYTGEKACFRQAIDPEPCFLPLARVRISGAFGQVDTVAAVVKYPPASYVISNKTAAMCQEIDKFVFQASVLTRQVTRNLNIQSAGQLELSKQAEKHKENCTFGPEFNAPPPAQQIGETGNAEREADNDSSGQRPVVCSETDTIVKALITKKGDPENTETSLAGEFCANGKAYYDRKAKLRPYEEGSSVLVLVPSSRTRKLSHKWEEPVGLKVVKCLNDVNYTVKGIG